MHPDIAFLPIRLNRTPILLHPALERIRPRLLFAQRPLTLQLLQIAPKNEQLLPQLRERLAVLAQIRRREFEQVVGALLGNEDAQDGRVGARGVSILQREVEAPFPPAACVAGQGHINGDVARRLGVVGRVVVDWVVEGVAEVDDRGGVEVDDAGAQFDFAVYEG